jgi:glycosyltransferase involved in cell wall biosynthesis
MPTSTEAIELSIVMPCLNEAETLATCIDKAQGYLERSGVVGEVVIADNGSTDGSQDIARAHGARVVDVPAKGYGSALMGGNDAARGEYVIMGDADDSYDFSRLDPFVERLRAGDELVMGNRFKGGIAEGAMPPLHKYLGNPVLSWIGRVLFRSPIGDFHCGLRGFNRRSILNLHLQTTGMEFASEVVVKSTLGGLRVSEVPTTLDKDGRSRPPHLRSWRDGWRHLRFLFCHAPDTVLLYPGFALALFGLVANLLFMFGDVHFLRRWGLHSHAAALGCLLIGLQAFSLGVLARHFSALLLGEKGGVVGRLIRGFRLETGMLVGAVTATVGIALGIAVVVVWGNSGFGALDEEHLALTAVAFATAGVQLVLVSFFAGIIDLQHARVTVQAREDEPEREWATPASVSS